MTPAKRRPPLNITPGSTVRLSRPFAHCSACEVPAGDYVVASNRGPVNSSAVVPLVVPRSGGSIVRWIPRHLLDEAVDA